MPTFSHVKLPNNLDNFIVDPNRRVAAFPARMTPRMTTIPSRAEILELDEHGLRRLVSSLIDENEALKSRLATFEAVGGDSRAQKRPSCGSIWTADQNAAETPEIPILPNEIILKIAEYFTPGSRTLANLAKSCRGLYELLLPQRYKEFSVQDVYSKLYAVARRPKSLPSCLNAVEKLETRLGYLEGMIPDGLTHGSRNVVELGCNWMVFCSLYGPWTQSTREKLEVLNVTMTPDCPSPILDILRRRWGRTRCRCPNLRVLRLDGQVNVAAMQFFDAHFARLQEVHVGFTAGSEWDPTELPRTLIAKIRSWTCDGLEPLLCDIDRFPMPALESISLPLLHFKLLPRHWNALCSLPALRTLRLTTLDSSLLLTGFPPCLTELRVCQFHLTVDHQTDIPRLQAIVASTAGSRMRYFLDHWEARARYVDMGEARQQCYDAELLMWEDVDGFSRY